MRGEREIVGAVLFIVLFGGLLFWLNHTSNVTSKMHTDYSEVTVHYKGHPLHCVALDRGVSCDWGRWHQETGR